MEKDNALLIERKAFDEKTYLYRGRLTDGRHFVGCSTNAADIVTANPFKVAWADIESLSDKYRFEIESTMTGETTEGTVEELWASAYCRKDFSALSALSGLPSAVQIFLDCTDTIITPIGDGLFCIDSNETDMPSEMDALELVVHSLLCVEEWTEIDNWSGEGVNWDIKAIREEVRAWLGDYFCGW